MCLEAKHNTSLQPQSCQGRWKGRSNYRCDCHPSSLTMMRSCRHWQEASVLGGGYFPGYLLCKYIHFAAEMKSPIQAAECGQLCRGNLPQGVAAGGEEVNYKVCERKSNGLLCNPLSVPPSMFWRIWCWLEPLTQPSGLKLGWT